MDIFYKDCLNNSLISWKVLIDDLKESYSFNPYCFTDDYYEIFKRIILSILLDENVVLLDSDFSTDELLKLTGFSDFLEFNKQINKNHLAAIKSKKDLIQQLEKKHHSWTISLYTSGTTGLPKKVTHNHESITRFIRVTLKHSANIWGFAYNPTHMAGIQVFLQALLNGNPIIRLFGLTKEMIFNEIESHCITNISATPTFYRLILPHDRSIKTVTRITSGGEKFDNKTLAHLKRTFPNAKITNVYASTEAGTLFASSGNVFTVKPHMRHLIKIVENELQIHKDLIGVSELNSEEWYLSGDLVEIISENQLTFRIISRKNEMINVGGYKVNPIEVEEVIRTIEGVKDVRIFAKSNSVLGSIVCCEIVRKDEQLVEVDIRAFLQLKLQEYKIPRIISFVDQLSITRTGKLKR